MWLPLMVFSGMLLGASPARGVLPHSTSGPIAVYHFWNLTQVPLVANTTVKLLLAFNRIRTVNATSFPLLEELELLELGNQATALTIHRDAFRNLPNLKVLDLGYNPALSLDPDAFRGLYNLLELRLFYCGLSESVLRDGHLRDLHSLIRLDLSANNIQSLPLHTSFRKLRSLKILDLSKNQISSVCERDLQSIQGKYFSLFILADNQLFSRRPVDWGACGNPFRNILLNTLDVSGNGWSADITRDFCAAINRTQVSSLVLRHHVMGSGFGFENLKDPNSDTFSGLERSSVVQLDLSHGFIFSIRPWLFWALKWLKVLSLTHNKINRFEKGAFYGLDTLQILNLSYNLLGELYNSNFDGLPNIKYIDLKQNHIGAIQDQTFTHLKELRTLDLRDNAIKEINFLPSIDSAFLSGNKLVHLKGSIISAEFLHLGGNRLENLDDLYLLLQIPCLKFLILNQNRFSYCYASHRFTENFNLTELYLSENMLQLVWETGLCWDVFKGLSHLRHLYLNNNYLSFLPPGVFSNLISLQILSLNGNRLISLSHGDLPDTLVFLDISRNQLFSPDPNLFMSLKVLDITHNRYICECELREFLGWLNQSNVTFIGSANDMYCVYPESLSGVSLYSVSLEDCDEEEVLRPLKFSLFLFFTVSLLLIIISVIVYTQFRGFCFTGFKTVTRLVLGDHPKRTGSNAYKYDAYLCFSSKDFEWVQRAFLMHLDSQYNDDNRFNLCFEARDFLPGEEHISNIRDAIWNSRKTICVVTRQFLKDGWCIEAFNFAQSRYFSDLKEGLIMVVAGSLSQYQLMKYQPIRVFIQRQHYFKWPENHQDVGWFLDKLSQSVLKEKEVKKKANQIELQTIRVIS
ncbi:toll-like receptor 5 [Tachyglossus aculeatus]|uniref:toll-like receptor 5 n=1 Tax=Tachyglossus aculeatus TaxID=9261 RepID=UPI0018F7908D|nr:toll-like receptor 5 [Tachyglossus aculeatus]XP_038616922.1 toll-like receptor 5 [Tachyglossus aculeatus]